MSTVFSFFLLYSTFLFCICLSLKVSLAHILGNETDRLALLAVKSQITQDPFRVMSSWNDSRHFCDWKGIICSHKHQRVRVLDLSSRNLGGSISPHVGNLSFLMGLALSNNSFEGKIPQGIGHLFRLKYLYLDTNYLAGEFPVSISLCSNLIVLMLSQNNLVGNMPVELGSLSNLAELILDQNNLTGEIPPSLGNLTRLQNLTLGSNQLSGSIPSTLGQLKALHFLSLGENQLSGMVPPSLFNLTTLEVFDMVTNDLSGKLPSDDRINLSNLKKLLLRDNRFSGSIPTSLFNASGLQRIDISYNHFTGKVPVTMGNLKDLQVLSLEINDLGSGKFGDLDFIAPLTNSRNLQILTLSENKCGGMMPASIGNFSNQLQQLYLGFNKLLGKIPSEIGNLQNLIILSLPGNLLTGSIPTGIKMLQKLQILELTENQLSGHLPSFLSNMSQLYVLHLSTNFFKGSILPALHNRNVQILSLSGNNISGTIPENIGLSQRLIMLNISNNLLNGSIPSQVGNLKSLILFEVSNNKMSGEIPSALGSCVSMQYLYLEGNSFQGSLPSSLGSLKDLKELDVSRNNFSSNIPKELEKLSDLSLLNLAFNAFEGAVPTEGIFKNSSEFSVLGNDKICGGVPKLGLPKCEFPTSRKKGTHLALKVTLGVLIPLFILGLFLVVCLNKKTKGKTPLEQSLGNLKRVSYNDLHKATDGFSFANLIGMGSYGSVYKGLLAENEGHIAVKVFNLMERGVSKTFMAECEVLRQVRHRNLLKILTVCSSIDFNGNDFKALIFDFMHNGSLENWLHQHSDGQYVRRPLNVYERLTISIDIASALDYLHNHWDKLIVHCDLKPSNVLLGDDLTAHVTDFGLAKFIAKNKSTDTFEKGESSSIAVRGTTGYIPPEYGMGAQVSTQGDMYSYGILLLEMFTGKRPTDHMFKDGLTLHGFSKTALPHLVMDIIDLRMLSKEIRCTEASCSIDQIKKCLSSVIKIGVVCSSDLATDRMNIKDVLKEMHAIRETSVQLGIQA